MVVTLHPISFNLYMKKVVINLVMAFGMIVIVSCKKTPTVAKNINTWTYEVECVNTGVEGTYLLKVWSYSRNQKTALNEAKRNAVHGVIFRGFASNANCYQQSSLATSPGVEEQNRDYFKAFFADGGKYLKYATNSNDGSIAPEDRVKVGNQYKLGVTISIQKDLLRQELEQAGVIRRLDSGF